jgi:hypothetical protein
MKMMKCGPTARVNPTSPVWPEDLLLFRWGWYRVLIAGMPAPVWRIGVDRNVLIKPYNFAVAVRIERCVFMQYERCRLEVSVGLTRWEKVAATFLLSLKTLSGSIRWPGRLMRIFLQPITSAASR